MKIDKKDAIPFIKSGLENTFAILLYGPDIGLKDQYLKLIASNFLQATYAQFSASEEFKEKIFSYNLSGRKTFIKIDQLPANIKEKEKNFILDCLKNVPETPGRLIFCTEDSAQIMGWRRLFEKEPGLAAISCYHENAYELESLIKKTLSNNEIQADLAVIKHLAIEFAEKDRLIILQELEKLVLFALSEKRISLENLQVFLTNKKHFSVNKLTFSILSQNKSEAISIYENLLYELVSPIYLIRCFIKYCENLLAFKQNIVAGKSQDASLKELRPPLFFMERTEFLKLQKEISAEYINSFLAMTINQELAIKTGKVEAELAIYELIFGKSFISSNFFVD